MRLIIIIIISLFYFQLSSQNKLDAIQLIDKVKSEGGSIVELIFD